VRFKVLTAASLKTSFWDIDCRVVSLKHTEVSKEGTAFITRAIVLMMEVVCSSETKVYFSETRRSEMPECCHLEKKCLVRPGI
jgi:hypothetical protein